MIEDIRYQLRCEWVQEPEMLMGPAMPMGRMRWVKYLQFKRDGVWTDITTVVEERKQHASG